MRKVVASLVAVVALVGACGGDDSSSSSEEPVDEGPPQSLVDASLLTVEDLASDDPLDAPWIVGDVAEGVDIVLPDCIDEELLAAAPADGEAKFVTQNDLKLPSIEQHVGGYPGQGSKAAFNAAVERLDACEPEFTYQGTPSTGTMARLELPTFGDESAAWRLTVTIAGTDVAITTLHVWAGDLEMSIVHTDVGTPDVATLTALFTKAADKLA